MSCILLQKEAKLVRVKQWARLPCLVVSVMFQFAYATTSKIISQISPPVTTSYLNGVLRKHSLIA